MSRNKYNLLERKLNIAQNITLHLRNSLNSTMEDLQKTIIVPKTASQLQDHINLINYIKYNYVNSKESLDILNLFNEIKISESKNHLNDLYKKVILFGIKNVASEIKKYYDLRENDLSDIQQLLKEFDLGYNTFSFLAKTASAASNFSKTQELFKQIIKNINILNINISSKDLLIIMNNLQFFKSTDSNSEQRNVNSVKLFEELISVVDNLNSSRKWYNFLIKLDTTLSDYDVQKNINQYKSFADDLKKKIKKSKNETSKIFESLKILLDKVMIKDSKLEYDNYKDIKLNKPKLTFLEKLLNSILLYEPNALCDSNPENRKVNVIGSFIKLSDITNKNYINFTNTTKKECNFQPKYIEIFAVNKIFINDDFKRTADLEQLSIIAPTWEIVGSRKITLDGVPGKAHDKPKAPSAYGIGLNGTHGHPGYPGGSAGHFVGIVETIINGTLLNISAIGGEGGPGQNGGDGGPGKDGHNASADESVCTTHDCKKENNCTLEYLYPDDQSIRNHLKAVFLGTPGEKGGKGGDSGRGGQGGNPGNIFLNTLHNYYRVSKYYSPGVTGKNGISGKGGPGGNNGDTGVVRCLIRQITHSVSDSLRPEKYSWIINKGQALQGDMGTDGGNTQNIKKPELVTFYKPYIAINKFKNYLRENLGNSTKETYLMNFISSIESNSKVKMVYNINGLIDDLLHLEDQFFELKDKISFLPFYESLLDRIYEYEGKTEEEKEVLRYLYAAALSKICSYKRNVAGLVINSFAENSLIVDIKKYLGSVIKDIRTLQKSNYKATINNYENEYKNVIDKKINEAKNFIESSIEEAINDIFDEINNKIGNILNKMIIKENMTIKEKEELVKQKDKLENQLFIKGFLGIIKIASHLLSFTGPVGATVNSAISEGIEYMQSDETDISSLLSITDNSIKQIKEQLTTKQSDYQKRLKDAEDELGKYLKGTTKGEETFQHKDITNIKTYIKNTREQIEQKKNEGAEWDVKHVNELYDLQKKLGKHLEEQKTLLEKENSIISTVIDDKIKVLNRIQNLISIPQMPVELYGKIKDQLAKIDKLDVAIKLKNDKINELLQHEHDIYKILVPAFSNLGSDITRIINNSNNTSHAVLDINKWKIRSSLKDVKHLMQIITKEFNDSVEQENLKYLIDKLDDSMSTMIDVFNRIEEYRSKAELAEYLKNIQSNKQFEIQNNELQKLEFIINSNRVLEKHEIAMNAFRQYIFPYAYFYLKPFNLPPKLKSTNNKQLTKEAIKKIVSVKEMLEKNDMMTNPLLNDLLQNIKFKSTSLDKSSLPPFYVWKHVTNKPVISRFLEGQEIILKADIRKGLKYDAIKFNEIGIRFKLQNKENQTKLDNVLDNFILSMTHLGNSYYRCDDKFYVMTSPEQKLKFYLQKDNNGESSKRWGVYETIRTHDPILSPYTTWKLKLHAVRNNIEHFLELAKYKDQEIDLELEGGGQYIPGESVCVNMDEYYVLDDSTSEINNDDLPQLDAHPHRSNLNRNRRSVNKNDLVQNIEENAFATSGSSRNVASSFINNIVNSISNSFSAFKNVISINLMGKRLTADENNIYQGVSNKLDVNNIDFINLVNVQSTVTELTVNSYKSIDNQKFPSLNSVVNVSMIHSQNNLVLLDLLIRWKNGVKYGNDRVLGDNCDLAYAQMLAYKQNVPASII